MHFSILLYHCWKDSSGILSSILRALLMASMPTGQVTLMTLFELGEKKNVTQSKIRWIGMLLQSGHVPLDQELLYTQNVISRYIVVVKQQQFVLTQLLSLFTCMWCYFWSLFSSLGIIFAQTFCIPKYSVIIFLFHVQLICSYSDRKLIITTHHIPYPLDAGLKVACWRPFTPGVIFPHFVSLFKLDATQKHVWNMVLFPYTWWSILSTYNSFS